MIFLMVHLIPPPPILLDAPSPLEHIVNIYSTLESMLKQRWTWVDTKSSFVDNLQCLWNYDNHVLTYKRQPDFKVEITSTNTRLLNFHFQPNIKVGITSINFDNQRCFKIDATLICICWVDSHSICW